MTRASFAKVTLTKRRYPLVSDMGTSVVDLAGSPTESTIANCWLEPTESTIVTEDRVAVLTGWKVTAPEGTQLDATRDRVVYAGVEYELAGDAMPVPSPTGALNEVMFTLRRWRHAA